MSGLFDLHVHTAPDVLPRYADDRRTALLYERAGFSGCVLKAHYDGTANRARTAGDGLALRVYGSLVLNSHVGGCNPAAVELALEFGARIIWMPTQDSHTQQTERLPRFRRGLPTVAIPPVNMSNEPDVREILRLIAEADAVLATGHLSAAESEWLLPTARAAGVQRLLLTHPTWTIPSMDPKSAADLVAATRAYAEITCVQILHQPEITVATLAELVQAVGPERIILSSDAGQTNSPPPPDALQLLIDTLIGEGFDPGAMRACASEIPERLVTPTS